MIRQFDFEGESLVKALEKTFAHRKTAFPDKPPKAKHAAFLEKPIKALAQKKSFDGKWKAPGPWR